MRLVNCNVHGLISGPNEEYFNDRQAIQQLVDSHLTLTYCEDGQKAWKCVSCGKVNKHKTHLRDHIESHHVKVEHNCPEQDCGKAFGSTCSLRHHIRKCHR